jgi:uncharacterized protein (TIGR00369 family)
LALPFRPMSQTDISLTPAEVDAAVAEAFPAAGEFTCVELGARHALVSRGIDRASSRPGGYVSGPAQFAMADTALWYLAFGVLDRIELMALTSDVDITYLRPATGDTLWARADLLSAGGRKIVGAVRVWCDDRDDAPSAVAKGAYVLPRG